MGSRAGSSELGSAEWRAKNGTAFLLALGLAGYTIGAGSGSRPLRTIWTSTPTFWPFPFDSDFRVSWVLG